MAVTHLLSLATFFSETLLRPLDSEKVITVISANNNPLNSGDKNSDNNEEYDEKGQIILELKDAVTEINEENIRLKDAIATNQLPDDEIVTKKRHFGVEKQMSWNTGIVATCEARQCADED